MEQMKKTKTGSSPAWTDEPGNVECGECGAKGTIGAIEHRDGCSNDNCDHDHDGVIHRVASFVDLDDFVFQKEFDEKSRTVSHIISTNSLDRMNDVVDQEGMSRKNFMRNPVVLANHRYAIESIIGKALSVEVQGARKQATVATTRFAEDGIGQTAFNLVKGDLANAWSIGFKGTEGHSILGGKRNKCAICAKNYKKLLGDKDPEDTWIWGRHFTESELVEYSLVAVPANPDAVMSLVKEGVICDRKFVDTFFVPDYSKAGVKASDHLVSVLRELNEAQRQTIVFLSGINERLQALEVQPAKAVAAESSEEETTPPTESKASDKDAATEPNPSDPVSEAVLMKSRSLASNSEARELIDSFSKEMKRLAERTVLKSAANRRD